MGLKYFKEFQVRIPREEVTKIVDFVKAEVEAISGKKNIYDVICCGSYRRLALNPIFLNTMLIEI